MFPILTGVFGIKKVAISNSGVAQKNDVEIMMVLDRSGSMAGSLSNLKTAALSFLSFFAETEDNDKMGLVTYSNGVTVNHALSTNFVSDMTVKINAMTATWATNAEDAIDQSDGPSGFTDQTGLPGDQRVQQYLIFFTDGRPTAFRGSFRYNGTDYDAVVMGTGNYCDTVYGYMGHTDSENFYTSTGQPTGTSLLPPTPTGDGNKTSGSPLTACTNQVWVYSPPPAHYVSQPYLNMRWYIFGDAKYGLPGYSPVQCSIPTSVLAPYICNTAKKMAIDHAQELKDKGIKIYIIGLEGNGGVDTVFLGQVASGPTFEYYAPTSDQLQAIFNAIAKEIKLRLVG
jgi:Mg-chelatase subunit ChlD